MTDADIALATIKAQVKNFTQQTTGSLAMLYGRVGQAKGPQDTAAVTDGRATIAGKLGDDSKLKAVEDALKALHDWAA
jgi:hypothetical protein